VEDVVVRADLPDALELLVEPAERRALIARDHRSGVKPAPAVGAMLVQREPDQRLHAGQQDRSLLEQVLVVERDLAPLPAKRLSSASGAGCPAARGGDGHAALLRSTIG
jgi:hypothetical protein